MAPNYKPNLSGKEQVVICPFNSLHIMLESSLQRHIIRCMKKYPDWVVCPYNALHRFPTRELLTGHMIGCESKRNNNLYHEPDDMDVGETLEVPIHVKNVRQLNFAEENWDE